MERPHTPNIGNDDGSRAPQFRLARITLEKLDTVFEPFAAGVAGQLNTVIRLDRETRRAPARRPTREHSGAATDSATVSPGRTERHRCWAYAPKRPASAIIAPKSRREYISTDGNTSGGGVISGR